MPLTLKHIASTSANAGTEAVNNAGALFDKAFTKVKAAAQPFQDAAEAKHTEQKQFNTQSAIDALRANKDPNAVPDSASYIDNLNQTVGQGNYDLNAVSDVLRGRKTNIQNERTAEYNYDQTVQKQEDAPGLQLLANEIAQAKDEGTLNKLRSNKAYQSLNDKTLVEKQIAEKEAGIRATRERGYTDTVNNTLNSLGTPETIKQSNAEVTKTFLDSLPVKDLANKVVETNEYGVLVPKDLGESPDPVEKSLQNYLLKEAIPNLEYKTMRSQAERVKELRKNFVANNIPRHMQDTAIANYINTDNVSKLSKDEQERLAANERSLQTIAASKVATAEQALERARNDNIQNDARSQERNAVEMQDVFNVVSSRFPDSTEALAFGSYTGEPLKRKVTELINKTSWTGPDGKVIRSAASTPGPDGKPGIGKPRTVKPWMMKLALEQVGIKEGVFASARVPMDELKAALTTLLLDNTDDDIRANLLTAEKNYNTTLQDTSGQLEESLKEARNQLTKSRGIMDLDRFNDVINKAKNR